ncbi:MAG: hypothetical protein Q4E32_02440 [Bacteroidales bacterium]|nr:hypothetical protein [Bacteroidales bacterium]
MEHKEKILILADDDFVYGANENYYNEYNEQLTLGNLGFINLCEAKQLKEEGIIPSISKANGEIFILNPYSQEYISESSPQIEETFIHEKAIAYQRALLLMGAQCVFLEEAVKDIDSNNVNVDVGGGIPRKKGQVEVDYNKELSIDLNTKIRHYDANNKPSSLDDIQKYLLKTSLIHDSTIKDCYEQLKLAAKNGGEARLTGIQHIDVDFTSELISSVDIAAKLDFGPLNINTDVSVKHRHLHSFHKMIRVYFDNVPENVKKLFENV